MTDFDPNHELHTQEQADAYVNWSAENFMRLSQGPTRTYRTGVRCAHWLLVVSAAQLHLDEGVTTNREALLEQLALYSKLARAIERQRQHLPAETLIVLRASLDCWEPVGIYAPRLLTAAKCAVAALRLIDQYPLIDLWNLGCPDVWALLEEGSAQLGMIALVERRPEPDADRLNFDDYAIRPSEKVTAAFTWQRVNNLSRSVGHDPLSPN